MWCYEVILPDYSVIAVLHIGHGVALKGYDNLWRIVRQQGTLTLTAPGSASRTASLYIATTSSFGRVGRIFLGEDRFGGYLVEGNGWRGSRIRRAADNVRVANLFSEGDPATIYHMTPAQPRPELPLEVALLAAYFLTDRDIRHGSWVPRPGGDNTLS